MKLKISALILSLLMSVSLSACNKVEKTENGVQTKTQGENKTQKETKIQDEVITTSENTNEPGDLDIVAGIGRITEYNDSHDTVVNVNYPVLRVSEEDKNNFPELNSTMERISKEERQKQLDFIEEYKEEAIEFANDYEEVFMPYQSFKNPVIRRADAKVTSILISDSRNIDAMNEQMYFDGKNIDTKTGKELGLSDVVNDTAKFNEAVCEQFGKLGDDITNGASMTVEEALNGKEAFAWILDYNGITVYFQPHTVTNYVSSVLSVHISNEEYPDILKAEYKEIPESYGIGIEKDTPFFYDVTGDGRADKITFSYYHEEYGDANGKILIFVNDKEISFEEHFFDAYANFVHAKNGKNYIYIEYAAENGYCDTVCYEISDDLVKTGSINGEMRTKYTQIITGKEDTLERYALTNPDSFYMSDITQHISTATGYRRYYSGENGVPVSYDDYYIFDGGEVTLTLKKSFKADVYDIGADKVTGEKVLEKGDVVEYFATDYEKYALLKCSDGTVLRIETDDKYGQTIEGVYTSEIFDGLFFAG